MRSRIRPLLLFAPGAIVLAACGSTSTSGPSASPDPFSGSITVFAASSLTSPFNTAEKGLELDHPGFTAQYSYGSSQALVTQIINGAPADVIATANTSTMQQLVAKGLVDTPQAFVKNKLEIIVAPGNPKNIKTLADLATPGLSVVLAMAGVPVGDYATKALKAAKVSVTPKSLESDDALVVEQVESGNADAALVFVTDVVSAGSKVTGIAIPDAQNVIGTYEIAVLKSSTNTTAAQAFVDLGRVRGHPDRVALRRIPEGVVSRGVTRRPLLGLLIPAAVAVLFIALPLIGLLAHVDWSNLPSQLVSTDVLTALRLSLECSVIAVVISLVIGVPLAYLLARTSLPGRRIVRGLVTLPLVLPPVVGGIALQTALGRTTPIGTLLDHFGIVLPFSTAGAAIAEAFVGFPFLVITVEAGLRQRDDHFEEVAATLGARPWRRFWQVTLPLAAPSIAAGAALCWARALGEFGATITFAGSFPGTTETLPIAAYSSFEGSGQIGMAITLSLLLLAISVLVLVVLRDRWLGALR